MFGKKDVIFSETQGVCVVHDITKLTEDRGNIIQYYVLKNVFYKDKVSYIPVENHQVVLRELIREEEAGKRYRDAVETGCLKDMDELLVQEIAYVLKKTPEELRPADEE